MFNIGDKVTRLKDGYHVTIDKSYIVLDLLEIYNGKSWIIIINDEGHKKNYSANLFKLTALVEYEKDFEDLIS